MGPTPSSNDRDHGHDDDHDHGGRDACGVPLRAWR
jgi:hypothetical protein